jgi:hypothetical protein
MSNPLRHIDDATDRKPQASARCHAVGTPGASAAELIADELTMIRAEMSTVGELLADISSSVATRKF